jgi:L-2-hydroxycarboxylate dehydrogenase (NAD+)
MTVDARPEQWIVDPDGLATVVQYLLRSAGFSTQDATTAADVLLRADLRGFETHGVSNMLRKYLRWVADGHIDPSAQLRPLRRAPATTGFDSHAGLGVVHAPQAMGAAIEMAREAGIGMATVINGRHCGMASYHSLLAAEQGMVGIAVTAGGPRMVPTGARGPRLGTNPIAVAAPLGDLPPFSYDASTTVSSLNRVRTARRRGLPVPGGLAADAEGVPITSPTTDPAVDGSRLLPLGGTEELGSYKGSGLGAIVELVSAILGGSRPLLELGTGHNTHAFVAVRVDAFVDPSEYAEAADAFGRSFLDAEPRAGASVRYAGWRAARCEQERRAHGIPLDDGVVRWLQDEYHARGGSEVVLAP